MESSGKRSFLFVSFDSTAVLNPFHSVETLIKRAGFLEACFGVLRQWDNFSGREAGYDIKKLNANREKRINEVVMWYHCITGEVDS